MVDDLMLTRGKMVLHSEYFESYLKEQYQKNDDEMAN
jgi:hypothetical protein